MSGSELEPVDNDSAGGLIATVGGFLIEAVHYAVVISELTIAAARLALVGEAVRSTYRYVERSAASVDRLADQMASLTVDSDTIGEHRDAAAIMRDAVGEAEAMAAAAEDLSSAFKAAADAHEADYGSVNAAVQAMTVPMADPEFYSNR